MELSLCVMLAKALERVKRNQEVIYLDNNMSRFSKILVYVVLLLHTVIVLVPVYWMLITAFKTPAELMNNKLGLPKVWHFENFVKAWNASNMGRYLINSTILVILVLVICVGSASMIAFILSRFNFRGRHVWYIFFIAGLMVPVHAVIIPIYDMAVKLNALNNLLYLSLVYSAFFLPLAVFILYSFMRQIPYEIEESAIIDGCNEWKIFVNITLPISHQGIISVSILTALNTWNDLLLPLILLNKNDIKTISIGLRTFFASNTSQPILLLAAGFISMMPVLLLYAVLQEKVIKGLTIGALKG